MGVSENSVPPNPMVNDHYPYEKWLFHWEYTQHFQTNPYGTHMVPTWYPHGYSEITMGEKHHLFFGSFDHFRMTPWGKPTSLR